MHINVYIYIIAMLQIFLNIASMPNIATPRNNETVMQDVTSPSLSVFLRCEPEAHNK